MGRIQDYVTVSLPRSGSILFSAKVELKPKSKKKVVMIKVTPKVIPLPFLEEPTEDPRRSKRKKDKDKEDDDEERMVH